VPEHALHGFDVGAGAHGQRCGGVPQLVRREARLSDRRGRAVEPAATGRAVPLDGASLPSTVTTNPVRTSDPSRHASCTSSAPFRRDEETLPRRFPFTPCWMTSNPSLAQVAELLP
jgi:hypothetical protein